MQLQKASDIHSEFRRSVLAAMETGNAEWARTLLNEYAEDYEEQAKALHLDVVQSYGIAL